MVVIIVKSLQISQTNSYNASHGMNKSRHQQTIRRKRKAFSNQMWSECNLLPFFCYILLFMLIRRLMLRVQEAKIWIINTWKIHSLKNCESRFYTRLKLYDMTFSEWSLSLCWHALALYWWSSVWMGVG